ncbi:MAG: hypothetical protein KKA60_05640 [Proteobacteria bacterium]|nr:hypothetical protein [Pseudomonadota bacterium]
MRTFPIKNHIRRFWIEEKPSWWFWAQLFAPVFLLVFACFRSYMEMVHFSAAPAFSFYRTAHHILWFASAMMTVVLWLHLLSRIPLADLLWVFFGIVATGIPLVVAWITGTPMALEYHNGSALTVIRDILTFSFFQAHNVPIAIEGVIIAVGFFFISWLCILEWKKSLLSTVLFLLTLNLYAVAWLAPEKAPLGYFRVASSWSHHPFLAVLFLGTFSLLTVIYAWRTGIFRPDRRPWLVSAAAGILAWAAYGYAATAHGWFPTPWDRISTGLPLATAVALAVRGALWGWGGGGSPWALVTLTSLLLIQLVVMDPIYLKVQERFVPPPRGRFLYEPVGPGPTLVGPEAFPLLLENPVPGETQTVP